MRITKTQLISVLLAMVIGLASVQLAAARGQSPAVGTMVICTGTGPVHILVDETGQPTGGVMVCPDYAMAFFADLSRAMPDLLTDRVWLGIRFALSPELDAGLAGIAARARSPPGLV